ncbi:hypothetical protein VST7929_02076 [Vibrio stylophorae]|uniref:Tyrosine specific protein phosphatases domain-containing protein n=1 Tax=Vibrio stylophorae TaxID=659351 RepID=A0ABM8ZV15_9VIBR|nr:tyrosine-protein phosphatase [Vibrio stylophorae]CAH0534168.1 hypothetical protein VST7929_02076 [Vibrio stylophorae]
MSHPYWTLPVREGYAALVLTPCPGTQGSNLEESLLQLQALGVRAIVTALTEQEMANHQLSHLGQTIETLGIDWLHAPIEDDQTPDAAFLQNWLEQSKQLKDHLSKGHTIALHCMGGSGRTGLLAAHILLEQGWDEQSIVEKVQALRPNAFTKTNQRDYLRQLAQDHDA